MFLSGSPSEKKEMCYKVIKSDSLSRLDAYEVQSLGKGRLFL